MSPAPPLGELAAPLLRPSANAIPQRRARAALAVRALARAEALTPQRPSRRRRAARQTTRRPHRARRDHLGLRAPLLLQSGSEGPRHADAGAAAAVHRQDPLEVGLREDDGEAGAVLLLQTERLLVLLPALHPPHVVPRAVPRAAGEEAVLRGRRELGFLLLKKAKKGQKTLKKAKKG